MRDTHDVEKSVRRLDTALRLPNLIADFARVPRWRTPPARDAAYFYVTVVAWGVGVSVRLLFETALVVLVCTAASQPTHRRGKPKIGGFTGRLGADTQGEHVCRGLRCVLSVARVVGHRGCVSGGGGDVAVLLRTPPKY